MKLFLFTLFFFCSLFLNAQEKYFIYFKDKGNKVGKAVVPGSAQFEKVKDLLSERAIERRKKNLGENFITFGDIPVNGEYIKVIEKKGIKVKRVLNWFNAVSAYITPGQLKEIKDLPFVEKIEVVQKLKRKEDLLERNLSPLSDAGMFTSNPGSIDYGPSLGQLNLSGIPEIHSLGINGNGVIIGLLDTGYEWTTHPALANSSVLAEYDFVFDDNNTANQPGDSPSQSNHGTYVFSIVGGFKEGELIGAAYGADYLLAKTEDIRSETHVEEDNYAAALQWMEAQGVDITSSSLGYNTFDTGISYTYANMDGKTAIVTKAAEMAFNLGVVTITSAGNEGNSPWFYITAPADGFNTLGIGAVTPQNVKASFSSHGPTSDGRIKPDITTQGTSVYGAETFGLSYTYASGTSAAAPIAAGVAGLLLSTYPHLKNFQVRKILLESGDNASSPDNNIGHGLLSARKAIMFPNIAQDNGINYINKIFIDENGVNPATVSISLSINDGGEETYPMEIIDNLKYRFQIPALNSGDSIKFYFKYNTNNSIAVREPAGEQYYKSGAGTINVSLLTGNKDNEVNPVGYFLSQNYPNPFNASTMINVTLPVRSEIRLVVYNILGQKIRELFNGLLEKGERAIFWDGTNDCGRLCPSGPYFYSLFTPGNVITKKMILLK